MEIKKIFTHPRFDKKFHKLPKRAVEKALSREQIFRHDPFDPRLKTHKLHGRDQTLWSFYINRSYRIKFIFISPSEILFLDVGTHNIYS